MHALTRTITMHAPTQRLNAKHWKLLPHQPDPGSRRDGNVMRICWHGSTHSETELDHRKVKGSKSNAKWGSARSPSHYGILTITHASLHGQRQDLPLAAVGPHRRFHRHSHRAHPSLSAPTPRRDRTLLSYFCYRQQKCDYVVMAVMCPRIPNEPGFATSDGMLRHIVCPKCTGIL